MRQVQVNRNLILREDGKLFNIRTGEEYIPVPNSAGYYLIRHFGIKKLLHSIVMELFGPPKPGPEYEIDHINRNRLDNNITNLRWVTRSENCRNKTNNLPEGQRHKEISDREYNTAKMRRWRNKHREQYNKWRREYDSKNRDKIRNRAREWRRKKKNQE